MELTMRCVNCKAIQLCKHTFGSYWRDKSSDGQGCKYPLDPPKRTAPPVRPSKRHSAPPVRMRTQELFKQ